MIKGGYKIVDLKKTTIDTENGTTISGIYEALENNYNKAVLLSGIVIDSIEKPDIFVTVTVADSTYTITAYGKTYTITSDDLVKIA